MNSRKRISLRRCGTFITKPHLRKGPSMLRMALLFLVIAILAGAMGLFNIANVSSDIAWTLFVVFLVLFVVSLIIGRPWGTGPPA